VARAQGHGGPTTPGRGHEPRSEALVACWRELVRDLTGAGMSTRAIGGALGIGDRTVRVDLTGASNDAPVTGLDGKVYPRPRWNGTPQVAQMCHLSSAWTARF